MSMSLSLFCICISICILLKETKGYKKTFLNLISSKKQRKTKSESLIVLIPSRVTTLMIIIYFAIQFGYYGLWLWFPELFNKLEKYYAEHPDDNVYICEVIHIYPRWVLFRGTFLTVF